jgi:hypothetical protein
MSDNDVWNEGQRERLRVKHRLHWLWTARVLCQTLLFGVAGGVGGWGVQHHVTALTLYGAAGFVLALAVVVLTRQVDNT